MTTKKNSALLKIFGFSEKDINRILKRPNINKFKMSTILIKVKNKIYFLQSLGYLYIQVIKIISDLPQILTFPDISIKKRIEDLIKLGYSKEETLKMTGEISKIFSYSMENIEKKLNDIVSLGYTKENALTMTYNLPALFNYSKENIKEKIEFYDTLGLHEIIISKTGILMQSLKLSCAREKFLRVEKEIIINTTNYYTIFQNASQFKKQFKITTEELLNKYDYGNYINEENNEPLNELNLSKNEIKPISQISLNILDLPDEEVELKELILKRISKLK